MASILEPGSHRGAELVDDDAFLRALLRVETAWMQVLVEAGAAKPEYAFALADAVADWVPSLDPREVEEAANPVLPLVRVLKSRVVLDEAADLVHAGLTSQDALDTAQML